MRLGFACAWDPRPELTWSHTPWNLRAALRARTGAGPGGQSGTAGAAGPADPADQVVDVGIHYPPAVRVALKAACARRHDGRWVSMWRHSRPARAYGEAALRRGVRRHDCDVVVQVQDLAVLDRPYLLVQDLSYDVLVEAADRPGGMINFPSLSRDAVLRLRDRQRGVYARAAGVLAMSQWFADHLVTVSGVPADRVRVVPPGASAVRPADDRVLAARRDRARRRLLFVGRDFRRKGGDLVVAALAVLRGQVDPAITLTVVGPPVWPLPGPVPDGVRFRGALSTDQVAGLFAEHDLFVLPSRFEAFGIAFVEALAAGLPCVGRRAYAMPEIIVPGRNGALLPAGSPAGSQDAEAADLAGVIADLLADDGVYRRTAAAVADVAGYYSWDRAAADVLDAAVRAATG